MLMNPQLEYAAYILKKRCGDSCDKTRFYNLIYLLDCMEVDFGFKLYVPYYWSHEGVVVKEADHLFNLRKRDLFDILPRDEKNTIDKAIKILLEKYKCKTSKELESEIYRDTPFPFKMNFVSF